MRIILSAIAVLFLEAASQAQQQAAPPLSAEQIEFFEKKIRPIFVERCYKCHSVQAEKVKGGLLLDSREGLLKGGDSGPAIVPGEPEKSILIKAIRQTDELRMPVKEKLPDDQIADFVVWVKMGAPDPRLPAAAAVVSRPTASLAAARRFWAFQPPREVLPPIVRAPWCRTPVDNFILAKLEERKMRPAPEADPRTLLRRVTLDLTGLPPTAQEIDAFLADASADAYEKVVDRLLASPRYGERWGRHWLDIARYADTKEWVVDEERRLPYPYTYRDWVIKAFNDDLPYDRFVMLQIAADRLQSGDDKTDLAALGFLTVGRSFLNRQPDIIDDRIDVVSRGLLGLTVTCARCHDHKYDPIPTKDYYSLYGIFASSSAPKEMPLLAAPRMTPEYAAYLKELGAREAEVSKFKETRRVEISATFRSASQISAYLLAAQETKGKPDEEAKAAGLNAWILKRWIDWMKTTPPELAAWRAFATRPVEELWTALIGAPAPLALAFAEAPGSLREAADRYGRAFQEEPFKSLITAPEFPSNIPIADIDGFMTGDDRGKLRQLRRKVEELHHHPGAPARAMTLEEGTPHNPRVFVRGNPGTPGDEVPRQFLAILSPDDRQPYKDGGRLDLAKAVASAQNPLTARVFVNRVWAQHFGFGLVRTPSNFGVRGDAPTHPELLDWLARAFIAEGWSVKKLHRLILLSSVYRQTTSDNEEYRKVDPLNLLLWRQNRRRLDLEAMRDSILAVSGTLDPTMGGRSVEITTAPYSTRRTVYGYVDRLNLANLYKTFDFAVPDMHSPGRFVTTIPQQALFMMNSPFVMEQAGRVAELSEIQREDRPERRIQAIYRRVYGREATPREVAQGVAYTSRATTPAPVSQAPIWQYGYGTGGADFHPLPNFTAQGWMGNAKQLPDPSTGWCLLTATGGHAGNDLAHAAIRRWTAPQAGTISISGTIGHHSKEGDGVHGRIVSSRQGELAAWQVVRLEAETKLSGLSVEAGETIDFVVDCRADVNSDSFTWAPAIRMGEVEWSAQSGFGGPPPKAPPPMSAWEKYVQVLLESNEFIFVD